MKTKKGGSRIGAGRPKSKNPKNKRISIKVTKEEHQKIKDLSIKHNISISSLTFSAISEKYKISL